MATEKRLIDASALWKSLDEYGLFERGNPRHIAQQVVEEQPTVDAVEVVRCGNCKHFREPFCIRRDDETHRERINMLTVDFCSYGERRD